MILLDVSACLVGFWDGHVHHVPTRAWLEAAEDESLGVCRVVHLGWLRLLTNPSVLGEDVLTRSDAWNFVGAVLSDGRFAWVEEAPHVDTHLADHAARDDHSHKLWTDDYLAAVALAGGHSFATLDGRIAGRYPNLTVIDPMQAAS